MKILVTTPSGKVGSELVRLLQANQVPFRLGAHTLDKARAAFPGAEVVRLDYDAPVTLEAAVQGVTALYLAAPGGLASAPEQRLVDAAKQAGVQRVVKLSAHGVENADVPLRQTEQYLEASGLQWTHLRPTWFMQNYSTSHAAAIRQGGFAEPAGDAKTGFIDARDIAEVAMVALTRDGYHGKAYALTGPELLDRRQVAERFTRELGTKVTYTPLSDEQFRAAMKPYLPAHYLEVLSALYGQVRAGSSAVQTDSVKRVLGREPRSFAQFVRDHRGIWS